MERNPSATLLRRLGPYCAAALESAATLCQTRAHAEITIEHWLLKLLEQGEGDITVIARRYEWDLDALWQILLQHLDALPRSVHTRPRLSASLLQLIKACWLEASLQDNSERIRSLHLLRAVITRPELLKNDHLWPLLSLSLTQLERLQPLLDAQSDERPDKQLLDETAALPMEAVLNAAPQANPAGSKTIRTQHSTAAANAQNEAHLAVLNRFTVDITAKAAAGQIDPVFGRETEIRQMIDILSRRRKNNPILVGEPGVGKTALVEGLALRLHEGHVPDSLKPVSVRTLDLGLLQAGAGVKGEFEQRLKNVIEAVQHAPAPILLFIDEAHTIIGAGNQTGSADAANLLKPALARGELRTIAATTWSEYKQYFERDAALERRFQMVKVNEPNDEQASLMLRGLKARYAQYHGVHIQDDAVTAAVTLSRRYLTGRQLPDKAVDLLDTASARVRMSLDTQPEALLQAKADLAALQLEQSAIEEDLALYPATSDQRLTALHGKIAEVGAHHDALEAQYQREHQCAQAIIDARARKADQDELIQLQAALDNAPGDQPALISLDVDVRTVATVIADWTGIPLSSLLKDEQQNLLELEHTLGQRVIGQDNALFEIAQRLRAAKTGLTSENGPLGVFLLVGPSGVGKTETALALADILFGGASSLITINLSEYQEAHTVSQLKGSPPGYVGYGQGGVLTEAVRQRPYSVILLDEVEKAHRDVLNLFYQVFDRGFMRDGEGREIDFRHSVILMTSNLGSDQLMALLDEQPDASTGILHECLRPILRDHFQPALLARFQTVIFRPLDAVAMHTITRIKLEQVAKRLQRHYGLSADIQESLIHTLAQSCLLPDTGARNIDSLLNQQILPALSHALLQHQTQHQPPRHVVLGHSEDDGIILDFH